jgi:hypothetical protein
MGSSVSRKYMKLFPILLLILALNSFAAEKRCQSDDDIYCQLDPLAPAVFALSEVCSESQPENKKYYVAAVHAAFKNHKMALEQLNKDVEFQEKLRQLRESHTKRSKNNPDFDCETVMEMGRDALQESFISHIHEPPF